MKQLSQLVVHDISSNTTVKKLFWLKNSPIDVKILNPIDAVTPVVSAFARILVRFFSINLSKRLVTGSNLVVTLVEKADTLEEKADRFFRD